MMKNFYIIAAAACSMLSASAAESSYSFNPSGEAVEYYGTGKKENYDIAVCLNNPALVGAKVTGIRVEIPGDPALYSSSSAFMTTELMIDRVDGVRVNVADICTVDATIADGWLTATFDEPYTLTESPIYVGYSFEIATLENSNKQPVAVVSGTNPDGFWFHSSRTALKWANYVDKETGGLQSAMTVMLEGDFSPSSAALSLPEREVFEIGKEPVFAFDVINSGSASINSVELAWKLDDKEGTSTYNFRKPVENAIGATGRAYLTLPELETAGKYPLDITITKVNGADNTSALPSAKSNIIFTPIKPVKLPLVEEYTGMWCGWCTRGYVALEWMKEVNGYDFVAAAWHNQDYISVTSSYPNAVSGFPFAYYNRSVGLDPGEIPTTWSNYCQGIVDYAITCTTDFTDDSKTTLKATAKVMSIDDQTATPKIGYLLVADGLSDPTLWEQSNYYAGNSAEVIAQSTGFPEKWAEFLATIGSYAKGLVFNDVVVNYEYSAGVVDSLPEEMEAFETYENEVTFDLTSLISNYTQQPINIDPEKVRVIAFILDSSREVINCCSSAYPGEPAPTVAVDSIDADTTVTDTAWFDLQGRRIANPANGLYLRLDTLSNGTVRASKVVIR